MQQHYKFSDVIEFLEYAGNHGLIRASTAQSYRVGCAKIEDTLTADEMADVRTIDVNAVFRRYENVNKLQVSPATLREYRRRVATSIDEFLEWRKDPSGYKPKEGRAARSKSGDAKDPKKGTSRRTGTKRAPDPGGAQETIATSAQASAPLLSLPFPIRADLLAHVQVPRDLTTEEANRLAAFIKTLATDFAPTN